MNISDKACASVVKSILCSVSSISPFFFSLKDSEMFVLFYLWKESIKDELCFKFSLFISHCDVTEM